MADEQVKVRFTKAYKVRGKDGESYKEGETVSLPPESAAHFTARGVAEEVVSKKQAQAEAVIEDDGSPDLGADRGKAAATAPAAKGPASGKK